MSERATVMAFHANRQILSDCIERQQVSLRLSQYAAGMLARLYVEALLLDPVLADQVWDLWNAGAISDELAALAWWRLAGLPLRI